MRKRWLPRRRPESFRNHHDMKHTLVILLLAAALSACAADSYQRVPLPSQTVEVSSPSMSRIYILRMPQVKGKARGLRVEEDAHEIGRIGRDRYLCWERAPGRSLVVLFYGRTAFEKDDEQTLIDVQAEAGQVYYYGVTVDDDWNKATARLLSHDEARAILEELEPAPKD